MTQGTPTSNSWVVVSLCLPWLRASAIYFHDNESTGPLCISLTSCRSMLPLWDILAPLLALDCYYKSAECEESASVNFLKASFEVTLLLTSGNPAALGSGVLLLRSLTPGLPTFLLTHPFR